MTKRVQTIEQTGKEVKLVQAGGAAAAIIGTVIMVGGGTGLGGLLLAGGLIAFVGARIVAWWRYG